MLISLNAETCKKPCNGYVSDYVNPSACGGAGSHVAMQLQTKADAKARTSGSAKPARSDNGRRVSVFLRLTPLSTVNA